jgi:GTPase
MDAKAAARAELLAERDAGIWTDDDGFGVEKAEDSADDE